MQLKKKSVFISKAGKASLDTIVVMLKQYPSCRIAVTANGNFCEACLQTSWDKTQSVINYLTDRGIDRERIIFEYGRSGPPDIVTVKAAAEPGPVMVPPPMPCYSYHKITPRRCKKGGH